MNTEKRRSAEEAQNLIAALAINIAAWDDQEMDEDEEKNHVTIDTDANDVFQFHIKQLQRTTSNSPTKPAYNRRRTYEGLDEEPMMDVDEDEDYDSNQFTGYDNNMSPASGISKRMKQSPRTHRRTDEGLDEQSMIDVDEDEDYDNNNQFSGYDNNMNSSSGISKRMKQSPRTYK
ncbi:hypothetical protein I4U23_010512 [Adineta vaga]|nr:hypothetical protein I4U23_010512 [Adineta vaga]